jgi:hypothetical protein
VSDSQTAWSALWSHAAKGANPNSPFEIDEVVPVAASALGVKPEKARKLIGGLLTELARLPEGKRFFTREGNAVVPLPEFRTALDAGTPPLDAYPYEL